MTKVNFENMEERDDYFRFRDLVLKLRRGGMLGLGDKITKDELEEIEELEKKYSWNKEESFDPEDERE